MSKYNWNPVFNMVMEIKDRYNHSLAKVSNRFTDWLEHLNDPKYNEVFDCVETTQKDNMLIIRYGLLHEAEGLWEDEDSILRECRSVVIDLEKEALVLTPFRKFFNLNEVEENKIDKVRDKILNAKYFEVADKLDGSMQSASWYDGDVFMSGSRSIDPEQSWRLADGYSRLTLSHRIMMKLNPSLTFIFEYIALKDSHVVHYNKEDEGLYLIGIRDKTTGEQFSFTEVVAWANHYNIPVVKLEDLTLDDLLEQMKTIKSEEKEGWVLNIDGHMIKVKGDDYVNIHRVLDAVSSVNVIIKAIADDTFDDLLSKVPDSYKNRVLKTAELVFNYRNNILTQVDYWFDSAPKSDRKTFAIWVTENVPKHLTKYVMSKYTGKKFNVLKNGIAGYKTMKQMGYNGEYKVLFADLDNSEKSDELGTF